MNSPNEHKVMVNWTERVAAFVDAANDWPADAVVNLGDFVNGRFVMAGPDVDLGEAERIEGILLDAYAVLTAFDGPIHNVIGNHDVYDLSKEQILAVTGAESTYYSYDLGGVHFVILDAQYDKNETTHGLTVRGRYIYATIGGGIRGWGLLVLGLSALVAVTAAARASRERHANG